MVGFQVTGRKVHDKEWIRGPLGDIGEVIDKKLADWGTWVTQSV